MAHAVVALGPLRLEQRLCPPIALLLAPEVPDRVAPVVPHERRWAEPQGPALLLEPPAEVHVVAGRPEARVPAVDRLERLPPERAVAARDVLGLAIRQEDVDRPAGGVRYAVGDRSVSRRRDVRSPDPGVVRRAEGVGQVAQPVRI